ncbi:hypothetical protein MBLNU459_g5186t1 [Dothideomycetes sp. NU459]
MWFFTFLRLKLTILFVRLMFRLRIGTPRAVPNEVLNIQSRDAERKIKVNVYKPTNLRQRSPVLINFHGSGFVLPMHGSDHKFCRLICRETDYTVLDVQYRLAPEHPFPAAFNDVEDSVNWVLKQPNTYDLQRVAISGFSAGGNLALAAASTAFPKGTFRSLLAMYPPSNLSIDPGQKSAPDLSGTPLPDSLARTFDKCYIPVTVDKKDPRVSPFFAPMENLPSNVLVVTAACDNLCLETEALAARIESTGRNVVRYRGEKCDHGWDKKAQPGTVQAEARDHAYALAVEMLRQ